MRATSKFLALALAAALQPAIAAPAPIELSFEDITPAVVKDGIVELLDRYAGVEFKGAAWGVTNFGCRGFFDFTTRDGGCSAFLLAADLRQPSPVGTQEATINLADGFITGSSLYYSALLDSGFTVTLYEELNGKGRIAGYDQGLTKGDCDTGPNFCEWTKLSLAFDGVAKSIVISGNEGTVMLDDLRFLPAAVTQPNPLPEPGGIALALAALGALGWARKRAAR